LISARSFQPGSASFSLLSGHTGSPFGWDLVALGGGFGLLAYAAVDREPGPALIGFLTLLIFTATVGPKFANDHSVVGWPLFLLILGGVGVLAGLRPMRPLPPEPLGPPAETVPFTPSGSADSE